MSAKDSETRAAASPRCKKFSSRLSCLSTESMNCTLSTPSRTSMQRRVNEGTGRFCRRPASYRDPLFHDLPSVKAWHCQWQAKQGRKCRTRLGASRILPFRRVVAKPVSMHFHLSRKTWQRPHVSLWRNRDDFRDGAPISHDRYDCELVLNFSENA